VLDVLDPIEPVTGELPAAIVIEAEDEAEDARVAVRRLRRIADLAPVPILVAVTVRGLSRLDAADAFDDFALIPYVPAELYQRIRRLEWRSSEFLSHERVKVGPMVIDLAGHDVTADGTTVHLTHQEFALLAFLAQHRGRVFTRQQLLARVWGDEYEGGPRTVDIHVRRLRAKLGRSGDAIETVRGAGYKMRTP
jgi:DNA-binding response OmpR family regulator